MPLKYLFLRKKYPRFVYENYFWKISRNDLEIYFRFEIGPKIAFNPKIIIKNIEKNRIKKVGDRVLDNLAFNLGLIELLSYWKSTCSPEIEIKTGNLDKKQIKWWKNLIFNGMGQFFYENRINFRKPNFLKITANGTNRLEKYKDKLKNNVLLPVGGGKDSVVTLEILKGTKEKIRCFSLNPNESIRQIIKIGGCKNPIIVERRMDRKLLELNKRGFLNGHTPFSAHLAFLSALLAVIFDLKYVAFSNERSSNEGNLKYLGRMINHQYSKSFDFEKKFREYSKNYLAKDVEYFSFLRPLYEIQIAKLFSNYPKYFNAFLSCNEAYKTHGGTKKPIKKWCGECPKCLFIFASLYPFIGNRIIKIFRKNLFRNAKLKSLMLQLIGLEKFKPFECVGTKKESLIAFYLSWKRYKTETPSKLPFLLRYFERNILTKYKNLDSEAKNVMNAWSNQNNLPKKFKSVFL